MRSNDINNKYYFKDITELDKINLIANDNLHNLSLRPLKK